MPRICLAVLLLVACDGSIEGPNPAASASQPDASSSAPPDGPGGVGNGQPGNPDAAASPDAINADGITVRPIGGAADARVLQTAAANNGRVWPLVAGVDTPSYVRTMINSSTTAASHGQTLVNLAVQHNCAGLDIDYEGL